MEPWTFVHVTDLHVGSPRSFRFAPAYNENWQTARKQIVAVKPDLLLVGGDLTRDGRLHDFEYESIKADLDSLPFPYHSIPGNMDTGNKHAPVQGRRVLSNRMPDVDLNITSADLERYEMSFGPPYWTFTHKGVRFTGFYGAITGSGLAQEHAMWEWLERLPELPREQHHVVMMHYPLFIDAIDEPTFDLGEENQYLAWYFGIDKAYRQKLLDTLKTAGVDVVLSGHIHCRKFDMVDGIRFYKGPSTAFPQWADRWEDGDPTPGFQRFDVRDGRIEYRFVPLERVSEARGYGPGGHPRPEQRDYSIAWEK